MAGGVTQMKALVDCIVNCSIEELIGIIIVSAVIISVIKDILSD